MSGDRLAQIEAQAQTRITHGDSELPTYIPVDDILALVEIAKDARDCLEAMRAERVDVLWSNGSLWIEELTGALARLDSGAAEGDA